MKATKKRLKQLHDIYDQIIAEFGESPYYKGWLPFLVIYHDAGDVGLLGEFDEDQETIFINLATHNTTKQVIMTMLHEYCHYLQHPTWYTRYANKYSYHDHPYEIQAWEFAEGHIHLFTDAKR